MNLGLGKGSGARALLIALIVLTALYGAYRYKQHRSVVAARAMLEAAGVPLTIEGQVALYPEVPDADNAALVYQQAFDAFVDTTAWDQVPLVGSAKLPRPGEPLTEAMRADIASYLDANAKALDLMHQAAALPASRYPIDLELGPAMELAHLARLRQGARLMALESIAQAEAGYLDGAVKSLTDGFGMGRSLRNEPIIISQLVRIACDGIIVKGMERVLNRASLSDLQLQSLEEAAASSESSASMTRALQNEVSNTALHFEAGDAAKYVGNATGVPSSLMPGALGGLYGILGLNDLDRSIMMAEAARLVEASRLTFPQSIDSADALASEIEKLPRWAGRMAKVLFPAMTRTLLAEGRGVATMRTARTGIALERYRLAEGHYPDSLDALVPRFLSEIPTDPFDGKPLRYQRRGGGYLVYSIGHDRKDDGGDEGNDKHGGTDVTFGADRES